MNDTIKRVYAKVAAREAEKLGLSHDQETKCPHCGREGTVSLHIGLHPKKGNEIFYSVILQRWHCVEEEYEDIG